MDEVTYRHALVSLERLRPTWTSSGISALTMLRGPRRVSRYLSRMARRLSDELDRMQPPADVAAEHEALIRALRRTASDLEEVADRKNLRARERFEAIAEIDFGEAEARALEAKGYRLPH